MLGHNPDVLGLAGIVVPWQLMNFYLRGQLAPAGCPVRGISCSAATWSAAKRRVLDKASAGNSSRCRQIAPREDAARDHRKLGLESQALQEESPAGARGLSSPSANIKSEMSEGLRDMRSGRAPDTPVAAHRRESACQHQAWLASHRSG